MGSHNKNPYRNGSTLGAIFAHVQKKQVVTRQELLAKGYASTFVNIILSPREEGKCKGIPQGNPAAWGHLYFMQKLVDKKLRLRWRVTPMLPLRQSTRKGVKVQSVKNLVIEKSKTTA